MAGLNGLKRRIVVSRFPTDKAILAEVAGSQLNVEFLEQVFIKRLSSYKSVSFEHQDPNSGFWTGQAIDRQAGRSGEQISEYWLKDFLDADFAETPAAGTRRLASALKQAVKLNPSLRVKEEIASASSLAAPAFSGRVVSISKFCEHFGFSDSTKQTIQSQLAKPSLFDKTFKFDPAEFKKIAPYRTVELESGAILTALNDEFNDVFRSKKVNGDEVEYTAVGRVVDQRLARH